LGAGQDLSEHQKIKVRVTELTLQDKQRIKESIKDNYDKVEPGLERLFGCWRHAGRFSFLALWRELLWRRIGQVM
jgi:hypothetical protein